MFERISAQINSIFFLLFFFLNVNTFQFVSALPVCYCRGKAPQRVAVWDDQTNSFGHLTQWKNKEENDVIVISFFFFFFTVSHLYCEL